MISYQIYINLKNSVKISIGKLGIIHFCKGLFIYTGSAKTNIDKRIKRHFSKDKKNHWHIDYFLNDKNTEIINVIKSNLLECDLNMKTYGSFIIRGFGSSDCKNKCGGHLIFRAFND